MAHMIIISKFSWAKFSGHNAAAIEVPMVVFDSGMNYHRAHFCLDAQSPEP